MKTIKSIPSLLALGILSLTASLNLKAQEIRPMMTVTAKDFATMMETSKHIQKAVEEQQKADLEQEFLKQAGNPNATGMDKSSPWHFGYWFTGPGQPTYTAYYIPVTDFKGFKSALIAGKQFRGRDNLNIIRKNGKYAVIIMRHEKQPEIAPEAITAIVRLRKELPQSIDSVYEANLHIDETLRKQLVAGLQMFRSMMQMQLKNPQGTKQNAATPFAAIGDILGLYIDFGTLVVNGLDNLTLNVDINAEQISVSNRIVAVPDSELAKLLKPTNPNLAPLAPYLGGDSAMAFAGHLQGSEFSQDLITKAMAVSAKLQGAKDSDELAKKMTDIMNKMLPMSFAGSFDMGPEFRVVGRYEFPDNRALDIHKDFSALMDTMTKMQIGEESLYSSYSRKAGARKVKGMAVDLITTAINTNSAMLKLPGQLEAFRMMWPDDKITYEIAGKGKRIYYSMGAPIEQAMNKSNNPAKLRVKIDKSTVIAGRYNFLKLMKTWLPNNPMMPAFMKESVAQLDHSGTGVDLKANLDGALSGQTVIPMKLLTQFSRFGKAMSKARIVDKKEGPTQEFRTDNQRAQVAVSCQFEFSDRKGSPRNRPLGESVSTGLRSSKPR
jgi:hypothetical protein